ncbi:MAG TPA: precorrin-6A synthase (deacetylating), partial [Acidimicrobiia bacterium]|nr:precorrin-6A synthase (deacetylating) [Acidimicrobiia bacterium]
MEPGTRRLRLIGVGPGDPRLLTVAAVEAIGATDVFFVLEKRDEVADLTAFRTDLLDRYARAPYRVVNLPDPDRDRAAADYGAAVQDWQQRRTDRLVEAIAAALAPGETGALLVWGDPSLYDGSLRMAGELAARAPWPLRIDAIPGVSSLHLLTARHRIPLNRIGAAVRLTTGRRLPETPPDAATDVVVFLDSQGALAEIDPDGIDIYWGAYLGTPDEMLLAGPLAEVRAEILRRRAEARTRKGWLFDVYLLR